MQILKKSFGKSSWLSRERRITVEEDYYREREDTIEREYYCIEKREEDYCIENENC